MILLRVRQAEWRVCAGLLVDNILSHNDRPVWLS